MSIAPICARDANIANRRWGILALLLCFTAAGCSTRQPPPPQATAAPKPAVALPLQQGVAELATAMVTHATLPPSASGRYPITIDPWIDDTTGDQVATTHLMQSEIETLAPQHFPQLELLPFTTKSLERRPLVLLGAITPVTGPGSTQPAGEHPGAYRIYGVLADLTTGKIAAAESVWVRAEDVDLTPTAFYRDSPVWLPDESVSAYLRTSAARQGDVVDSAYLENLQSEALLADAAAAYNSGAYRPALDLYHQAIDLPEGGHQVRTYNGLYLTSWALGDRQQAAQVFGTLVDYSLKHGRLAVKFLFRPGSTAFWPDPAISSPYSTWLQEIAQRTASDGACLRITGHSSPTGSTALNDRLSLARARSVKQDLVGINKTLRSRIDVRGVGAREPIVGTGRDDATDVLDRRVEFQPVGCSRLTATAG
jgi:outer membrane protein OmpA-like peptidoglycan-associated protein